MRRVAAACACAPADAGVGGRRWRSRSLLVGRRRLLSRCATRSPARRRLAARPRARHPGRGSLRAGRRPPPSGDRVLAASTSRRLPSAPRAATDAVRQVSSTGGDPVAVHGPERQAARRRPKLRECRSPPARRPRSSATRTVDGTARVRDGRPHPSRPGLARHVRAAAGRGRRDARPPDAAPALAVGAGGIALAAALGRLGSRAVLAPVRELTEAAEHVATTHDLSRRIEVAGDDELGRLAERFNTMLAAARAGARRPAPARRRRVARAAHAARRAPHEPRGAAPADRLSAAERRELVRDVSPSSRS